MAAWIYFGESPMCPHTNNIAFLAVATNSDDFFLSSERLVRKPQAIAYLGISGPTLDRWVRAGKIRRVKLSDRVSGYFIAELRAFALASLQAPSSHDVNEVRS
jgi:predicted DNA-binding transcriptional regulator AlpA